MRIFWHQGGLHLEPESEQERDALVILVANAKFGKSPGTVIPSGSSELGGDQFLDAITGNHKAGPRSLPSKANNQQHVVTIDKLG